MAAVKSVRQKKICMPVQCSGQGVAIRYVGQSACSVERGAPSAALE